MKPGPQKTCSPDPLRSFSRSLPMALLRAREAVMATFRPMLRQHDLTEQQWRVLRALTDADGPERLADIALGTFISVPSLSRLVRTLEDRGIVRRAVEKGDLRAIRISLTRTGRTLVARIAPQSEAGYAAITARIGADDLEALYALLDATRVRLTDIESAG